MQYLIIAVLSILFPDIYIWYQFVYGANLIWSLLYWLPMAITVSAMAIGMAGFHPHFLMKLFFLLMLCVSIPKLLFTLCSLIGKVAGLAIPSAFMIGNVVGIGIAIMAVVASIYGFTAGWKHLVVKEKPITFPELPQAFDGYSIVQLSDLHIGTYTDSPETVDLLVQRVNDLKPDLILFTGDLVNTSPLELDMFMDTLSRLRAKDGVFSILGNHDYCEYQRYNTPDGPKRSQEELQRREKQLGWDLLLNEHRIIRRGTDSIAILGVENDGTPPFHALADLPKASAGLPSHIFKILMSHDPSHWRRAVLPETDIQLTLSGHTHAMQLKIGSFSPSMWTYREWGGLYTEDGKTLHVSIGTGSNVAFRLGAWPEINVIKLYSNQK